MKTQEVVSKSKRAQFLAPRSLITKLLQALAENSLRREQLRTCLNKNLNIQNPAQDQNMGANYSAHSENFEEDNLAQNRRRSANTNNEENDDSAESNNHRVQSDDAILNEFQQEANNSQKKKNPPRGSNKCLKLNNLSQGGGKKIITFYQNRAIEPEFSRYLGIIIRDKNICPVAIENWAKIPQQNKDHMWASIKDKFDAEDMEQKRESVMRHLRDLWNKWRGDMHKKYVKENSLQVALGNKPAGVSVEDWDWLVKEHYFSSKFQKASEQNTLNRGKRKMLHHTGSKPFRQIAWELGGKSGNPPDVAKMFHETRKKANETLDTGDQDKYDEIVQVKQANPLLSDIEIVEKIWGKQSHGHITAFGGGTTLKDLRGPLPSRSDMEARVIEEKIKNQMLQQRLDEQEQQQYQQQQKMCDLESQVKAMQELFFRQPSSLTPQTRDHVQD